MSAEAEEYREAVAGIEESYKAGLRAFAKWFAANWKTSREQWQREGGEIPKGDWFEGYNAGVTSVEAGVDLFLDEFHH